MGLYSRNPVTSVSRSLPRRDREDALLTQALPRRSMQNAMRGVLKAGHKFVRKGDFMLQINTLDRCTISCNYTLHGLSKHIVWM